MDVLSWMQSCIIVFYSSGETLERRQTCPCFFITLRDISQAHTSPRMSISSEISLIKMP